MAAKIFSFFGPPGAGKGTLAQRCAQELGFEILSTGNLCRKHVSLKTELGKLIDRQVKAGKLVPDELITCVVADWLLLRSDSRVPIILDGYPRTTGQVEYFLKDFKDFAPNYEFRVVCFMISEEEAVKRLTNRFVCKNKDCQAIYSSFTVATKMGNCECCGEKLIRREDDRAEVAKERLKRYPRYRDDLLDFYKSVSAVVEELNVDGKGIEETLQAFKVMV